MQTLKTGLINTFDGKELGEKTAVNDGSTYAFRQYRNLLVFTKYHDENEKGRVKYHSTMKFNKIFSNDDLANIYYLTKFMKDEELAEINEARRIGCGCGKCSLPRLPRLAYIGNGEYKECVSQKQRVYFETEAHKNYVMPDLNELIAGIKEQWEY